MDFNAPISTVMSKELKTVAPDSPATEIDTIFKENRIHHIPVLNEARNVVGIVGKSDFLYLLRGYTSHESDRFRETAKLRAFKAMEIMEGEVETILETDSIRKAVHLLAENRYQALPVVNEKGSISGIVTTHDILSMIDATI